MTEAEQERAAVIRYLRVWGKFMRHASEEASDALAAAADDIEAGDHLKDTQP